MMKKILCLVMLMLILTGCTEVRKVEEAQESTTEIEAKSCDVEGITKAISEEMVEAISTITRKEETEDVQESLYEWQIEFTDKMFQELPDVPDWESANAYISFLEGYKPSNKIISEYEQKKKADELLGGYFYILYQGEEINYMPPYEDKLYAWAMFQRADGIVKGHQVDRKIIMTYPNGENEEITLDIIPEGCVLLTTVSVHEGKYLEFFEGFSICYDQNTSEVVCVRFDEEIGKRVKISSKDLEEFLDREEAVESYPFLSIGYMNDKNELVYPTIIEDETGIRFEILKKAMKTQEEQLIYFSSAIVDDINFKVYNNHVYRIDNVKRRINLDGSEGFCYGIWTTGEEKIKEIPIDFSCLNDVEVEIFSYGDQHEMEVCALMEDMIIFGKDIYMYQGQFEIDKFQSYLFYEGVGDRGRWGKSSLSLKYDNWEEAESTVTQLKKEIMKQEVDNQTN